jgi:hypothetical protein
MRSITSGSASTSALKMKKIKKLHSPNVIPSSMLAIPLQIFLTKKVGLSIACSSPEDAAPVESTVGSYIRCLLSRIARP